MSVQNLRGGNIWANSYIVGNVLVDAGVTPMAVEPYKDIIEVIILTHCHYDHTSNIERISEICHATVAIHQEDAHGLTEDYQNYSPWFGSRSPQIVPDIILHGEEQLCDLHVIHTPGHTKGSVCLYSEEERALLSGDTVFSEGRTGRYDLFGGSRDDLLRSLESLSHLDLEGVYPGHGAPVLKGGSRNISAAVKRLREES